MSNESTTQENVFVALIEAVISGDISAAENEIHRALGQDIAVSEIISRGLLPGMDVVGERFRDNEMFIPEVILSARAMHKGLEVLKPLIVPGDIPRAGRVVLGTAKGDLHDIGKNLVGIVLEGAGCEVIDLGIDVPPPPFVKAVREHQPDIVGISALLTTTMHAMDDTIQALEEVGLRDRVKWWSGEPQSRPTLPVR